MSWKRPIRLLGQGALILLLAAATASASWDSETIATDYDEFWYPTIEVDPSGNIHIFYILGPKGTPRALYWRRKHTLDRVWPGGRLVSYVDGASHTGFGPATVAFDGDDALYLIANRWIPDGFGEDTEAMVHYQVEWSDFASSPGPNMLHASGRWQHVLCPTFVLGEAAGEEPWMDAVFSAHLRGAHFNHDLFWITNYDDSDARGSFGTPFDVTNESQEEVGGIATPTPRNLSDFAPKLVRKSTGAIVMAAERRRESGKGIERYQGLLACERSAAGAWGDLATVSSDLGSGVRIACRDAAIVCDDRGSDYVGLLGTHHDDGDDFSTLKFYVCTGNASTAGSWNLEAGSLGECNQFVGPSMTVDSDDQAWVVWTPEDKDEIVYRCRDEEQEWSTEATMVTVGTYETVEQLDAAWDGSEPCLRVAYVVRYDDDVTEEYYLRHAWGKP